MEARGTGGVAGGRSTPVPHRCIDEEAAGEPPGVRVRSGPCCTQLSSLPQGACTPPRYRVPRTDRQGSQGNHAAREPPKPEGCQVYFGSTSNPGHFMIPSPLAFSFQVFLPLCPAPAAAAAASKRTTSSSPYPFLSSLYRPVDFRVPFCHADGFPLQPFFHHPPRYAPRAQLHRWPAIPHRQRVETVHHTSCEQGTRANLPNPNPPTHLSRQAASPLPTPIPH